jgi:hypothetical protein
LQIKVPPKGSHPVATVIVVEVAGQPDVVATGKVIRPATDGTLTLSAIDAEVIARNARLEKKGDNPHNIGYWTDVHDHVQWSVRLNKPGQYDVHLEYSCDARSGGSEYAIEVLGAAVKGKIEPTSTWLDFKTITVGTVEVKQPGTGIVVVRPLTKPGVAVMDLRKVMLRPK